MTATQEHINPATPNELLLRWLDRVRESQFTHNEATKYFGNCHYYIGIPATVLSTIVGTSVFASLGKTIDPSWQIIVGLISVFAAVLSALQTMLRFSERAEKHHYAAARYGSVRRRIEEILVTNSDKQNLITEIASLRKDIDKLASESPVAPERIRQRAKILVKES